MIFFLCSAKTARTPPSVNPGANRLSDDKPDDPFW